MHASLQGFYYFQPRLRGKEELLLNVINEDLVSFYLPPPLLIYISDHKLQF